MVGTLSVSAGAPGAPDRRDLYLKPAPAVGPARRRGERELIDDLAPSRAARWLEAMPRWQARTPPWSVRDDDLRAYRSEGADRPNPIDDPAREALWLALDAHERVWTTSPARLPGAFRPLVERAAQLPRGERRRLAPFLIDSVADRLLLTMVNEALDWWLVQGAGGWPVPRLILNQLVQRRLDLGAEGGSLPWWLWCRLAGTDGMSVAPGDTERAARWLDEALLAREGQGLLARLGAPEPRRRALFALQWAVGADVPLAVELPPARGYADSVELAAWMAEQIDHWSGSSASLPAGRQPEDAATSDHEDSREHPRQELGGNSQVEAWFAALSAEQRWVVARVVRAGAQGLAETELRREAGQRGLGLKLARLTREIDDLSYREMETSILRVSNDRWRIDGGYVEDIAALVARE